MCTYYYLLNTIVLLDTGVNIHEKSLKSRPNILVPLPANFLEPPIPAPAKNGHPGQAQILIQVG